MLLYDSPDSGNCFKVRLMLARRGIAYERRALSVVDRSDRERTLGRDANPALRVPTLRLDDGRHLAESGAILWYLAEGSCFIPDERFERAQVLRWLCFEQYSHEPYVATPRFIVRHLPPDSPRHAELPQRLARGRAALTVMETHLSSREYFVGERYSIADIALYAYTHVAPDGGLALEPYPRVRAWLARVAAQPRHVGLLDQPPTVAR